MIVEAFSSSMTGPSQPQQPRQTGKPQCMHAASSFRTKMSNQDQWVDMYRSFDGGEVPFYLVHSSPLLVLPDFLSRQPVHVVTAILEISNINSHNSILIRVLLVGNE
jgi:hypothetical protein